MLTKIEDHEGKKYLRHIMSADGFASISIDFYCVVKAFGVTCPARVHALKKLLCCGNRGKGSQMDDLIGAMAALNRAIDLQRQEDIQSSPATKTFSKRSSAKMTAKAATRKVGHGRRK